MLGIGSSASLGIGLAVYLDDKFTNPSRRLTSQVNAMGMSVNQFRGHVRTLEIFAGGVFLAANALQKFAKFDKTMHATGIIGGITKNSEDYKALVDQTMKLSGIYGQLPTDIALTNLELAKAGKSVPGILKLQEAVTALGAATDTKVGGAGGAADMLVNIMQAFNAASDQGMYYADIMTSAANRSTIDVTDLYESLKYSSDVARSLHIPFQQAAVSIATLGNAGLKGSMAGVAYANMLRYIATGVTSLGTKKQQKVLASWGLTGADFRDANGNLKDLGLMLEILRKKTATMNDPDKIAGLTAIFGVRGARGLVPLMSGMTTDDQGKPVQTFEAMRAAIMADVEKGVAKSTALERIDNLAGDLSKLNAAWQALLIKEGSRLEKIVRPIIQGLITAMEWLTKAEDSRFWGTISKAAFTWIMVLRPLRSLFAIFGPRILGAAAGFTNSFQKSSVISVQIANNIKNAANYFVAAMLKARGISMMGPGGSTLMSRGAGGKLTGGLGKATWLTKIVGGLFGRAGLRGISKVGAWFSKLLGSKFITYLVGTGSLLKGFGLLLGRVVGWLFGWPAMLADIGLTLLTGKGIFEWVWEALKGLWGAITGAGQWFSDIGNWFTKLYWGISENPKKENDGPADLVPRMSTEQFQNNYKDVINKETTGFNIHLTVNPTTGDKRTEYFINGNAERELSSLGIKQ